MSTAQRLLAIELRLRTLEQRMDHLIESYATITAFLLTDRKSRHPPPVK